MDQSICASLNLFQGTEEQMHFHEMGKEHSIYLSKIWRRKKLPWLHNFRIFYAVPVVLVQCSVFSVMVSYKCQELPNVFKLKSDTHWLTRLWNFPSRGSNSLLLLINWHFYCLQIASDGFVQLYLMPEIKFTVGCNYQLQWGKITFKGQTLWLQLLPTPPLSEMHNAALDSYLNITQQQARNPRRKTSFKLRPTHLITGVETRAAVVDKIITIKWQIN